MKKNFALVIMATFVMAPMAGAHFPPGPVFDPQDCTYYDDNLDGAAYFHDYRGAGLATTGRDDFPITINTTAPSVTFGDGNKDQAGVTVIGETNLFECPAGSKKEGKDPMQDLGPLHFDGEWDDGIGGVFLNEKHHTGCVEILDIQLTNPEYVITSDVNNTGIVDHEMPKSFAADGCVAITIPAGWGPPSKNPTKHCEFNDPETPEIDFCGLQRGWWIFVQSGVAGHIWTDTCASRDHGATCWT